LSFRHEVIIHAIEEEIHSFDFSPLANYSTILAKVVEARSPRKREIPAGK
jgi:hypothetical protein